MNPLVLLALGGVALLALTKKKPTEPPANGENGEPPPPDEPLPDVEEEDDHIVEEAMVESAGGIEYEARIWRIYEANTDYIGELFVFPPPEGENVYPGEWVGGPMADDLATVRAGLQEMADSFDLLPEGGIQEEPIDVCLNALPGPFQAVGYDEAQQAWVPYPSGAEFMHTDQPQTGMYWCVVSFVEGGLSQLEGRVTDAEGTMIYVTGPETDANVAASKAAYVSLQGTDDLPWPQTGSLQWEAPP